MALQYPDKNTGELATLLQLVLMVDLTQLL